MPKPPKKIVPQSGPITQRSIGNTPGGGYMQFADGGKTKDEIVQRDVDLYSVRYPNDPYRINLGGIGIDTPGLAGGVGKTFGKSYLNPYGEVYGGFAFNSLGASKLAESDDNLGVLGANARVGIRPEITRNVTEYKRGKNRAFTTEPQEEAPLRKYRRLNYLSASPGVSAGANFMTNAGIDYALNSKVTPFVSPSMQVAYNYPGDDGKKFVGLYGEGLYRPGYKPQYEVGATAGGDLETINTRFGLKAGFSPTTQMEEINTAFHPTFGAYAKYYFDGMRPEKSKHLQKYRYAQKDGGWTYPANTAYPTYADGGVTFSAGGENHRVYIKESPTGLGKGIEGHVMVNHPTTDKGKWDTIDLTEKAGAKTVAQGVAATRKWHRENPEYADGGYTFLPKMNYDGTIHVPYGYATPAYNERHKMLFGGLFKNNKGFLGDLSRHPGQVLGDLAKAGVDASLSTVGSVTGIQSLKDVVGQDDYKSGGLKGIDNAMSGLGDVAGTALKFIPVTAPFAAAAGAVGGLANSAFKIDKKNYHPEWHQSGFEKVTGGIKQAGDIASMFVNPASAIGNLGKAATMATKVAKYAGMANMGMGMANQLSSGQGINPMQLLQMGMMAKGMFGAPQSNMGTGMTSGQPGDIGTSGQGFFENPMARQGGRVKKQKGGPVTWEIVDDREAYPTGGNVSGYKSYASDPEYFDSHAVYHDNSRFNDQIRELVYAGTHEYNPGTGELRRLKTPVNVPANVKRLATQVGSTSQDELFERDPEARKRYIQSSTEEAFHNPLMTLPGAVGMPLLPAAAQMAIGFTSAGANALSGNYKTAALEAGLSALPFVPHTHRINPWRFKPQEEMLYRGIGEAGMKDAVESGVFRQAGFESGVPKHKQVWYAQGPKGFARAKDFANNFIVEVPETAFPEASLDKFRGSPGMQTRGTAKHIPITEGRILQKDWLRGYKPVKVSKTKLPNSDIDWGKEYFKKVDAKQLELDKLHGSKQISDKEYFERLALYEQELQKKLGLGKSLGKGNYGEVLELEGDPTKVLKLGTSATHGLPGSFKWTPENIESLRNLRQRGNIAIPEKVDYYEIPETPLKEVVQMPNLNTTGGQYLNLSKRDRYALFLKQARQLRDKGIKLDIENLSENVKFNPQKGLFDIYDVNPGLIEDPVKYMQYIKNRTRGPLFEDMPYKKGGRLSYPTGGNVSSAIFGVSPASMTGYETQRPDALRVDPSYFNRITPEESGRRDEIRRQQDIQTKKAELDAYYSQPGMISGVRRTPNTQQEAEQAVNYQTALRNDPIRVLGPDLAMAVIPEVAPYALRAGVKGLKTAANVGKKLGTVLGEEGLAQIANYGVFAPKNLIRDVRKYSQGLKELEKDLKYFNDNTVTISPEKFKELENIRRISNQWKSTDVDEATRITKLLNSGLPEEQITNIANSHPAQLQARLRELKNPVTVSEEYVSGSYNGPELELGENSVRSRINLRRDRPYNNISTTSESEFDNVPINDFAPGTPEHERLRNIILEGRRNRASQLAPPPDLVEIDPAIFRNQTRRSKTLIPDDTNLSFLDRVNKRVNPETRFFSEESVGDIMSKLNNRNIRLDFRNPRSIKGSFYRYSNKDVIEELNQLQKSINESKKGEAIHGAYSVSDSSYPLFLSKLVQNTKNNNVLPTFTGEYRELNHAGHLFNAGVPKQDIAGYINKYIVDLEKVSGKSLPKVEVVDDEIMYPRFAAIKRKLGGWTGYPDHTMYSSAMDQFDQVRGLTKYGNGGFVKTVNKAETKMHKALGNPRAKAAKKADPKDWGVDGDAVDNARHSYAGRYTSEAIQDLFPEFAKYTGIPQVAGFFGANALGAAHELGTYFIDPRWSSYKDWQGKELSPWDKFINITRESGEDAFNNMVGAGVGSLPLNSKQKSDFLDYLIKNDLLPDGYGEKDVFGPNRGGAYFKNAKKKGGPVTWQIID